VYFSHHPHAPCRRGASSADTPRRDKKAPTHAARRRPAARLGSSLYLRRTGLFVLLLRVTPTRGRRLPLALDATRAPAAEGRVEREVDVLLRVGAHEERGHVHDLLADANVALANEHARVVHRLGEAELEHQGLQTALEESLGVEREDVIELVLGFILW